MNILAEFKMLKEKLSGFLADQSKATLATLTEFSTKLTNLETGALAELESATASISSLTTEKTDLTAQVGELTEKLSASNKEFLGFNELLSDACLNGGLLDLGLAADATPEQKRAAALAVPVPVKFKAYQGALNAAFAKANLPNSTLPAAPVTAPQGGARTDGSMKREAYFKMTPQAQLEFVKGGGTIID